MHRWQTKILPTLELIVFALLMLFCLIPWLYPPQKLFSLRHAMDSQQGVDSEIVSLDSQHIVTINLPAEFRDFYNQSEMYAFRLYLDPRQLSPEVPISNELKFHLFEMLDGSGFPTRQPTGLFFYVVGVNLRVSQYSMRANVPSQQYRFQTHTPLTDQGKMLWYGRLATLPAITHDAEAVLEMIRPASKGFLCDTCFYLAPALTMMREL